MNQRSLSNSNKKLYLLATPIGNLGDLSKRSIKIIENNFNFIVENKNKFLMLLKILKIKTKIKNIIVANKSTENNIYKNIDLSSDWVLISEAGYPLICDPGYKIVNYFKKNNFYIEIISGPCALIHGLLMSTGPYYPFSFIGFIEKKQSRIEKQITSISDKNETVVAYISKYCLLKFLKLCVSSNFVKTITVCKELTKLNEHSYTGTAKELFDYFSSHKTEIKGEFTLVFIQNNLK